MGIVERIKDLCVANNTTIKALERQIGVSNGSIRHWNNKSPAVERVLHVAETFQVSLDWLVTGKEAAEMTPDELKLVEYYRVADEKSKTLIMTLAAAGAEQDNKEITEQENSSTSKIG